MNNQVTPCSLDRGISGLGWWVPLVPGILSRVVRKPVMSSRVRHSTRERGSPASTPCSASCCCIARSDPLLQRARRSAAGSCAAIHCCDAHSDLLQHHARRSTAASRAAIHRCVARGNPLLCRVWRSAASHAAMRQGQPMAQATAMRWMYTAGCRGKELSTE
jgi:hypothetical protein